MKTAKVLLASLCLVLIMGFAAPALAGDVLASAPGTSVFVNNALCDFKVLNRVTINAPEAGSVVVTASGMASFNANSVLRLTLSERRASVGPWQFWLTATGPYPSFNSFTVRYVFEVNPGNTTFYLNGRGCSNPRGRMLVDTGSMTAEFYPTAMVQAGAAAAAQEGSVQQLPPEEVRPVE